MSHHAEAEKMIESIASVMRNTVANVVESIAEMDNLTNAFSDIDRAFEQVIDVLDQMNERIAVLERKADTEATP